MSQNYGPAAWRAAAHDARTRAEARATAADGPAVTWRAVLRALCGVPAAVLQGTPRAVRALPHAPAAAGVLALGLARGAQTMLGVSSRIGFGVLGITLALLLPLPAFLFGYGTAGYWVADESRWIAGAAGFACALAAMAASWGLYHVTYGRYHADLLSDIFGARRATVPDPLYCHRCGSIAGAGAVVCPSCGSVNLRLSKPTPGISRTG